MNGKILIIAVIFCFFTIALGQNTKEDIARDFFAPKDQEYTHLLYNLEKYHLGPENFWKSVREGKYKDGLEDLKFVLKYFPNHPIALNLLGGIAKLAKEPGLPIYFYERALELYPEYAITHAQFGNYLVEIGRFEKGISELKKAVEIDPKLAVAYGWLAKAYTKSGNPELSRQAAEKAKELGLKTGQ